MTAKEALEHALLEGDAAAIIAAQQALEVQNAVDRAERVAELRAELAELDAARPELAQAVREGRQAAIAATDAVLEAQKRAELVRRDSGLAQNALMWHTERRRQVQADLDDLMAAIRREVVTAEAPVVRSLFHVRVPR